MARKTQIDRERGERIKYVRKSILGLNSQEQFANILASETSFPLTRGAVGNWELGKDIGLDNLKAIAELADISLDWLAYDAGDRPTKRGDSAASIPLPPRDERVPLLGYVRAGATAHYYATATDPLEWVPPIGDGSKETAALQIQGDSLGSFFDQWLVYYDEVRSPVTTDLIGKLCIVGLLDDRVVIKKIRRARAGLFDLLSNEGREDILNAEVVWAARVKQMVPR